MPALRTGRMELLDSSPDEAVFSGKDVIIVIGRIIVLQRFPSPNLRNPDCFRLCGKEELRLQMELILLIVDLNIKF